MANNNEFTQQCSFCKRKIKVKSQYDLPIYDPATGFAICSSCIKDIYHFIEANDIKEIITKRLLGKSQEGQSHLKRLFTSNEGVLKNSIHLTLQERSIYNQVLTDESFANI